MKDRFGEENRRFQWIVEKGGKLATLYGFDQVLQKKKYSGTAIACQREDASVERNIDHINPLNLIGDHSNLGILSSF